MLNIPHLMITFYDVFFYICLYIDQYINFLAGWFAVWGFSSHSRIFHSFGDLTILGEGIQI